MTPTTPTTTPADAYESLLRLLCNAFAAVRQEGAPPTAWIWLRFLCMVVRLANRPGRSHAASPRQADAPNALPPGLVAPDPPMPGVLDGMVGDLSPRPEMSAPARPAMRANGAVRARRHAAARPAAPAAPARQTRTPYAPPRQVFAPLRRAHDPRDPVGLFVTSRSC